MMTDCNGRSISTASVSLLCVNVVVNIYNLAIISYNDESTTQMLLGSAPEVEQSIILIQTVACISAIYLSTPQNIFSSFSSLKCSAHAITFATLCVDMILTCMVAVELILNNSLDVVFGKIKTNNNESVTPGSLYLIAALILAIYFVFKGYVVVAIFPVEKESRQDPLRDELLLTAESFETIELNIPRETSVSLTSPPSYGQCIVDSIRTPPYSPPPPYSVV